MRTNYTEIVSAAESIVTTNVPAQLFPAFLELSDLVKARPIRSLAFTDEVIVPSNPDFDEIRELVQAALVPPVATPPASTAPPVTTTPPTIGPTETASPTETPAETPTVDPGQAVETDLVC
jgi:hypothetical protein